VSIAANGQTNVVNISSESSDPQEAAHVAEVYAETYVKVRRDGTIRDLLDAATEVQSQMQTIDSQIADLDRAVTDLTNQIVAANSPADRQTLTAQRDALVATNAQQRIALEARKTSYGDQLGNLQLASNLTQTGGAQIVGQAEPSAVPVRPTPRRDAVVALFVGLLLGIGFAFLREYLDDTIKSKDELDAASGGMTLLSTVPRVDGWKDRNRPELVSIEAPKSPAAEAYRTLRTSVQFVGLERPMTLIQITSPAAAEGKTTTLANLGVALARAGKRVVMVDCDLRRPRIESFFGMPNEVGFTNVLGGDTSLADAVVRVPDEARLAILPAGPPPPNPSELLGTKRTTDVLRALCEEADYVLVDSPPVLPVSDSIILAGIVDATIVVVTADGTTKRQAQRALEQLQQIEAPVVGLVLNGVGHGGAGYGYSYGYSYGYTYGEPSTGRRRWLFGRRRARRAPDAPSERESLDVR
jgi:succinoglycan biosynthesis transport protein ExoP